MLAAWMRMKYPHKIWGALAASAPVRWFRDLTDPGAFMQKAGEVYTMVGALNNMKDCPSLLQQGILDLGYISYDTSMYAEIASKFDICEPEKFTTPELYSKFLYWVDDIMSQIP